MRFSKSKSVLQTPSNPQPRSFPMKTKSLFSPLIKYAATALVAAAIGTSAQAQNVTASDNASNYSGGWNSGSNGGTGFGPWTFESTQGSGFAGAFIGDPSNAGITGMGTQAFGQFANPAGSGASIKVSRSIIGGLTVGRSLQFQWAVNWDSEGGNKGFNILTGGISGTEIINVNQGSFPGDITFTGGSLSGNNTNIAYGTGPMTWKFERTSETNLFVTATARDGSVTPVFSQNITISGTPNAFAFYAFAMGASDNRQPYFNNFEVLGELPPPTTPSITSPSTANGTVGIGFTYQTTVNPDMPTTYDATGLPDGLSMNSTTGLISGTPQFSGNSSVTIVATNSAGSSGNFTLDLSIANPAVPTITSPWSAVSVPGVAFSYQTTATPIGVPTTFSASDLPSGFSIDSATGLITGTFATTGYFSSNISATNSGGTGNKTIYFYVGKAADIALNYNGGNWTNGSNFAQGSGFGSWTFFSSNGTGAAGSFLGNPAAAGIRELPEISFGLFANPEDSGAFIDARRDLSSPLAVGEALAFDWGINFDSNTVNGSKGIVVFTGADEAVNVFNGSSGNITVNGVDTGFNYGTDAMFWEFTQSSSNTIFVYAEPRNPSDQVFTANITTNGSISAFKFYAGGLVSGDERQPYFNNLVIMPASGPSPNPYSEWASDYSLDPNVTSGPTAGAPSADPDNDSFTNQQEYAFGTNPTQATVGLMTTSNSGGNLIVTFLARTDLTYNVQTTDNLSSTPFSNNSTVTASIVNGPTEPAPPTGYIRKLFTITPSGVRNFYRVIALDQPPG